MPMTFDEAWNDQLASQLDDLCRRIDPATDLVIAADSNDAAIVDRHSLSLGPRKIERRDTAAKDYQLRRAGRRTLRAWLAPTPRYETEGNGKSQKSRHLPTHLATLPHRPEASDEVELTGL